MLDLQHLRTFVAMVEKGNFTHTAKDLGCSQSTVTLHIQILERELGALLFERNRVAKTNVLTTVGQQLFEYAVRLLALADEAKDNVRNLAIELHEDIPPRSTNLSGEQGGLAGGSAIGTKSRPFVRHSLRPRSSNL